RAKMASFSIMCSASRLSEGSGSEAPQPQVAPDVLAVHHEQPHAPDQRQLEEWEQQATPPRLVAAQRQLLRHRACCPTYVSVVARASGAASTASVRRSPRGAAPR